MEVGEKENNPSTGHKKLPTFGSWQLGTNYGKEVKGSDDITDRRDVEELLEAVGG